MATLHVGELEVYVDRGYAGHGRCWISAGCTAEMSMSSKTIHVGHRRAPGTAVVFTVRLRRDRSKPRALVFRSYLTMSYRPLPCEATTATEVLTDEP